MQNMSGKPYIFAALFFKGSGKLQPKAEAGSARIAAEFTLIDSKSSGSGAVSFSDQVNDVLSLPKNPEQSPVARR